MIRVLPLFEARDVIEEVRIVGDRVLMVFDRPYLCRFDRPPDRAWKWNDQEGRFEAVDDPSQVSCWFQEQGDTPLEAWRESWDSWGRPNFLCEIVTSPES